MTWVQPYNINEKELYRVSEPSKYGWKIRYCTLEEVLYILSTKEEEYD